MTHTSHGAHRRAASQPGKSPEASGAATPCVVGALLRNQPELGLLAKAAAAVATLELVDDRLAIISTVLANRPGVLVIPPFDGAHISTAPLVLRVRREAPTVGILVISSHPAGAGQPILRAAQAGAYVLTSPTAAQLRDVLLRLLDLALPH